MSCFTPVNDTFVCHNLFVSNSISITKELTSRVVQTCRCCNPKLQTIHKENILTDPSTPLFNGGLDNELSELIIHKGDIIGSCNSLEGRKYSMHKEKVSRYEIVDHIGKGTFGRVYKCIDVNTNQLVAIKILKNKNAYFRQGLLEVSTLTIMNYFYDKKKKRVVEMYDQFLYCGHLCIVFELLGANLYQTIKEHRNNGMPFSTLRKFTRQLIKTVQTLNKAGVIHCDLKPENILLSNGNIKVIDLGSACYQNFTMHNYIQSRHYRSPEIVLEQKYSQAIDMWSVGCIVAEMFLGIPLFPGNCEYDLMYRFVQTLGLPPPNLLQNSLKTQYFFKRISGTTSLKYRLKEKFEVEWENDCVLPQHKNYLPYRTLEEIIFNCNLCVKTPLDRKTKNTLFNFLSCCFKYDAQQRITPEQALSHPFITGHSMRLYKQSPRETPYIIYGHSVTAKPEKMVADTFQELPLDVLRSLHFSREQYYDIFMKLLRVGHIPNITIESPFHYGSITPLQLAKVFKPELFENKIPHNRITPRISPIKQTEQDEQEKGNSDLIIGKLDETQKGTPPQVAIKKKKEPTKKVFFKRLSLKKNLDPQVVQADLQNQALSNGGLNRNIQINNNQINKENNYGGSKIIDNKVFNENEVPRPRSKSWDKRVLPQPSFLKNKKGVKKEREI